MRSRKFNECKIAARQRGVTMIIALIILVAMTLAGIGLMRSVDTGSMIAGNLAFRQATLNATDAGTGKAFAALMSVANSGNSKDLQILWHDNGQTCPAGATAAFCTGGVINLPGYSSATLATCEVTGTGCTAAQTNWWKDSANWATAYTLTAAEFPDTSTTVQYVIHRMCQTANTAPGFGTTTCQYFAPPVQVGCSNGMPSSCAGLNSNIIYYRITVRVTGPRNTTSYAQVFVQQPST